MEESNTVVGSCTGINLHLMCSESVFNKTDNYLQSSVYDNDSVPGFSAKLIIVCLVR